MHPFVRQMLVLVAILSVTGTASAVTTFTVNSALDPGNGVCDASECTLREAINLANSTVNSGGPDQIRFAIPGAGPHRIALSAALPIVTGSVLIQGYTQPGASVNTAAFASNAKIKIIIDAAAAPISAPSALTINAAGSEVSGLSIVNRAVTGAIAVTGPSAVRGCWLGVEPDGTTLGPNSHGLRMDGTGGNPIVGGPALADRNVIVAATANAVQMFTLTGARIENNLIGLKPDGVTPAGSPIGIFVSSTVANQEVIGNTLSCSSTTVVQSFGTLISGNRIGTIADGSAAAACTTVGIQTSTLPAVISNNLIGYTSTRAITVPAGSTGIVLTGNRFVDNSSTPIDLLGVTGHTGNDNGDADTGANNQQNYPLISAARRIDANTVELNGSLNSLPNTSFRLEFFSAERIDDGAVNLNLDFGDADRVGTSTLIVTTDASGNASFGPQPMVFGGSGYIAGVAATATRLGAANVPVETSEIGPIRAAYSDGITSFVVINTQSGGSGSFKQALLEAEAHPDDGVTRDRVSFSIPGSGPHTISLAGLTTLQLTGSLELDGSSQTGWQPNTASVGTNAQLPIDIQGAKLSLSNANVLVRGVVLRGQSAVLSLNAGTVEGCFIGVSQDGNSLASTPGNTSQLVCTGACKVGGSTLAARNLIGAQANATMDVVHLQGSLALVEGNLIGLRRDGITRLMVPIPPSSGLGSVGIHVSILATSLVQVRNNTIGGFNAGIRAETSNVLIENNRVGVGDDNMAPVGNIGPGIDLRIGGSRVLRNHIANNSRDGILVQGPANTNSLVENTVHSNGELGIDLDVTGVVNGDGVTPNDPLDADIGGNNGQNHPTLSAVTRSASTVNATVALSSLPNTNVRIRYCLVTSIDASGRGECDLPVLNISQTLTTDASGNASAATPALPYTPGAIGLTATAARIVGALEDTSEYAPVVPILVATSTQISAHTPDPAVVGQSIVVNIQVNSLDPALTASGGVVVSAPGAGSCNATLVAGSGACSLAGTSAGGTTITASYAATASFAASTAGVAHTINPAASVALITADTPDPSTYGDAITVSVNVTSAGGTPAAAVQISDGHGASCSAALAGGLGSCVLTPALGGAIELSAAYPGETNLLASSDSEPHQVNAVASTLTILALSPNPSVSGQPVNASAQLSSAVGTPSGPIVISDGAGASCEISGNSGSCALIPINAGAITLRADFAGNGTHLASSAASSQQVDRAATAVSAALPIFPAYPTEPPRQFAPLRFPASVSVQAPGAGVASGTITVQASGGIEACVITLPAGSCDLIPQTAGARNFLLNYTGDSRYLPSSQSVEINVLPDRIFGDGAEE